MDDAHIIDLYWSRNEDAIKQTAEKYSSYCYAIAFHILNDRQDSEECLNDTYLRAWNAIPPKRPQNLSAFLGRITRSLALNRYEKNTAQKRGGGTIPLILDELQYCLPAGNDAQDAVDELLLAQILDSFLGSLPIQARRIFMLRCWYLHSIKEIAAECGLKECSVKMSLYRTRKALKKRLIKEEWYHEK